MLSVEFKVVSFPANFLTWILIGSNVDPAARRTLNPLSEREREKWKFCSISIINSAIHVLRNNNRSSFAKNPHSILFLYNWLIVIQVHAAPCYSFDVFHCLLETYTWTGNCSHFINITDAKIFQNGRVSLDTNHFTKLNLTHAKMIIDNIRNFAIYILIIIINL